MAEATETAVKDPLDPPKDFGAPSGRRRSEPNLLVQFFHGLASLRLTVVLLFLGLSLVFFGTLAQVNGGIWQTVSMYFRSFIVWVPFDIFTVFSSSRGDTPVWGGFPFPGGWTIGFLLMANLLSAHALRFRIRVGVLTLHAGLIILLLSEFITGMYAVEMRMDIDEGSSANFAFDIREAELAIIDVSDPDKNHVVIIPQSILRAGELIEHDLLPFDILVESFYENSSILRRKPGGQSRATFGTGLVYDGIETSVASGTDTSQGVDNPSAYLTLRKKGSDTQLGTCLTSCAFGTPNRADWDVIPQIKDVDGKQYQIQLRYRRHYKPYSVYLHDFSFDRYRGTNTAKNFSSKVQLVDPTRDVDREVLIWMNHPLRYQGETFFQSSFKGDETGTVLQVVRNPGWLMPYISCTMISLGLLIHFSQTLFKFLRRELAK